MQIRIRTAVENELSDFQKHHGETLPWDALDRVVDRMERLGRADR